MSKTAPPGYMIQLDGLRALAAVSVIAQHTLCPDDPPVLLSDWNPRIAVRLFFVLSGFLITGILLRSRDEVDRAGGGLKHALYTFYARRSLRIFPLYYFALLAATLAGMPGVRRDFFWHLTYTTNYQAAFEGDWPESVGHFWSLAVEEQFYLICPAFILLTPRRWLGRAFVAIVLASTLMFGVTIKATSHPVVAGAVTPTNLDALIGGAMLALARREGGEARSRRLGRAALWAGLAAGLASVALDLAGRGWSVGRTLSHASNALIFMWLVEAASRGFGGIVGRFLACRPLVYVGTISYGIYVYHLLVPFAAESIGAALRYPISWGRAEGPWLFARTTAASIAVASLSWFAFEKPLNDLKRHFPYRGGTEPSGPGGRDVPGLGSAHPAFLSSIPGLLADRAGGGLPGDAGGISRSTS